MNMNNLIFGFFHLHYKYFFMLLCTFSQILLLMITHHTKNVRIYWNSLMLKFDCFQLFTIINAFRITDELTNMKNRLYYQFHNVF